MTDQRDLLAAIGEVVVNSASLEYAVTTLVATMEGHRDQECEDRALGIVRTTGQAMRDLRRPLTVADWLDTWLTTIAPRTV